MEVPIVSNELTRETTEERLQRQARKVNEIVNHPSLETICDNIVHHAKETFAYTDAESSPQIFAAKTAIEIAASFAKDAFDELGITPKTRVCHPDTFQGRAMRGMVFGAVLANLNRRRDRSPALTLAIAEVERQAEEYGVWT